MDSVKAFNKKGNQAFLYGKDNLGETCIALKNKTLGVVDVGKQTFFYVKDNPKEAYAVLKNEALKLKENSSSFVGNAYSFVVDGVTNTTGPEKMHFVAKNVFQTLAWKKALGAVGMLGKAPKHAVCSAITGSERQAGVILFAEKYGVRVQEIPRCCLKNARTSITREAVGMAAANQMVAHEGRQLLALANSVAITKSPQFLTQLPGTLALKAAAQAALSTNTFGAIGAGTSVVTPGTKAALIAGAVAESVASPIVLSNKVIVKVCKIANDFCQGAQVQAAKIVEKINQGLAPQMAFAGAEGCHELALTNQAAESMYMLYEGEKLAQTDKAVVAFEKEIIKDVVKAAEAAKYISFHQESDLLAKKFNNIREYLGKKLYFSLEHIFEGEIYKNGGLGGFHHDYLGYAKRSGIKMVKDIKDLGGGFYKALVLNSSGEWVPKSFFPDSWTREKVMASIIDALDNKISVVTKKGRSVVEGYAAESVKLRIVIEDRSGRIISAFPLNVGR